MRARRAAYGSARPLNCGVSRMPMPTKPIERLLFAQGGLCFFCQQKLAPTDASVEHLLATANGGGNGEENTVACCKALNMLLGRMSLKEKLRVVLNQKGVFKCPKGTPKPQAAVALPEGAFERVKADLLKRGKACPGTVKTLTSSINNLFQNQLSPQQLASLINKLKSARLVTVNGTRVSYDLTASA
jgi:hypothetical protein